MTLPRSIVSWVLFHAFLIASWEASAAISLTEKEINALARGEMVVRPMDEAAKKGMIAGVSFVVVNAPAEVVWRAFNDLSAWPAIFYNTLDARQLSIRGETREIKLRLGNKYIGLDFFATLVTNHAQLELSYSLDAKRTPTVDESKGWIRLIPQPGGRTLVVFSAFAKIPFGGIIALMGDELLRLIEYRLLSVPRRLKDWVESPSGEKYRP